MGASFSYTNAAVNHAEIPFCVISFRSDQVSVVNGDDSVVSIIRNNLEKNYRGIQKEYKLYDVYIFKCRGYPFSTGNSNDHQMFINCMCIVLKEMCEAGYIKIFSGDMNWFYDLSAWFFYKSPNAVANDIEFCALDLWGGDRLKLFNCDSQLCEAVKCIVNDNWKGIQKIECQTLSYGLKLKGYPWISSNNDDGVKNRHLIMKILQIMASYGWILYSATNIDNFTDTLFFCRKRNLYISREFCSSIFAISLNANDRLRLINADSSVIESLKGVIRNNWPEIQKESDHCGSFEFKLKGWPWWVCGELSLPSISLFCAILTELRRLGWKVMMNLGMGACKVDKGVFFFIKVPPKETNYCALSVKNRNEIFGIHLTEMIQLQLMAVCAPFFESTFSPGPPELNYAVKWTLKGYPWSEMVLDSTMQFNGQLLIASMVNTMVDYNYHVCSSANISSPFIQPRNRKNQPVGPGYKPDGDTIFFALDDPPLNVGLFTDQPSFAPMENFFSSRPPTPPPSYEVLYGECSNEPPPSYESVKGE